MRLSFFSFLIIFKKFQFILFWIGIHYIAQAVFLVSTLCVIERYLCTTISGLLAIYFFQY